MRNLFRMDGGLFRVLSRLADLAVLNLLFLLFCIPVVTIGPALTALCYVTLKMAENEEGYLFQSFWKSFRQNFRQALLIWLLLLGIACILGGDFFILHSAPGAAFRFVRVVITAAGILYLLLFLWIFPVLARFENSIRNTLRNAFLLAFSNLPRALAMLALTSGAVILTFYNGYTFWYGLLFWLLLGFSGIAFVNSLLLAGVFRKYAPQEGSPDNASQDKKDSETV